MRFLCQSTSLTALSRLAFAGKVEIPCPHLGTRRVALQR
jgi:hypothetical protein